MQKSNTQVAFWDAVNEYTAACGGDTSNKTISDRRMEAVAAVERLLRSSEGYEAGWVREKLGLPPDTPMFAGGGNTVAGALHVVCANAHGYLAYVAAYKCEDKQGEIARLTRDRDALDAIVKGATTLPTPEVLNHLGTVLNRWQDIEDALRNIQTSRDLALSGAEPAINKARKASMELGKALVAAFPHLKG